MNLGKVQRAKWGREMKKWRAYNRLSFRKAGLAMGIRDKTYWAIEHGIRLPRLETYRKFEAVRDLYKEGSGRIPWRRSPRIPEI